VNTVKKELSKIEGMEDYKFYYVDTEGNIYSHKYIKPRILKPFKHNGPRPYLMVNLSNGKGKLKSFYVSRIVASAFLPNHTNSWSIRYKDGNVNNNALSNLEWLGKKTATGLNTDHIQLSKELSDYIKLIHLSSVHKGIPVPPELEFFHNILNESLEEYINRYGLRKTMYMLENSLP
jgi:hypothetical protein